jgi:hypothetical protein
MRSRGVSTISISGFFERAYNSLRGGLHNEGADVHLGHRPAHLNSLSYVEGRGRAVAALEIAGVYPSR